jgi:Ni/Fe-hydrogenase subunit HybB-like protein
LEEVYGMSWLLDFWDRLPFWVVVLACFLVCLTLILVPVLSADYSRYETKSGPRFEFHSPLIRVTGVMGHKMYVTDFTYLPTGERFVVVQTPDGVAVVPVGGE